LIKKHAIFCAVLLFAISARPLFAATEPAADCPSRASYSAHVQAAADWLLLQPGVDTSWNDPQHLNALLQQLEQLADDGLAPDSYQPDTLRHLSTTGAAGSACLARLASLSYLQALHDLGHGRLQQQELEPVWHATPQPEQDPLQLAQQALQGLDELSGAFAAARPDIPQYQQLRAAWQQLRQQPLLTWPQVPSGKLLRPGMQDTRVQVLAERLGSGLPAQADLFDEPLVEALKSFQRNHGLQDDGLLGPATLNELNISAQQRRDQLRINLERWRWLARDLQEQMLLGNVSAGELVYYRNQQPYWRTRIIVGRRDRPTPLLKSQLNRLTLNPYWTVPPTIYRKDKLPAIREDPAFLAEHHLHVIDHQGRRLDSASIDWSNPGPILLRQDPGPSNPLGQIALRFANPFAVYLHDTPNPELFSKAPRPFSSGCVRVQQVMQMLPLLLDVAELEEVGQLLASGKTHEYRLPRPLPLLLGYWTAEADADGNPLYQPDIYGHDEKLVAALERDSR
jgi:murein L,D-transpeptidase YcbB/YkuD